MYKKVTDKGKLGKGLPYYLFRYDNLSNFTRIFGLKRKIVETFMKIVLKIIGKNFIIFDLVTGASSVHHTLFIWKFTEFI